MIKYVIILNTKNYLVKLFWYCRQLGCVSDTVLETLVIAPSQPWLCYSHLCKSSWFIKALQTALICQITHTKKSKVWTWIQTAVFHQKSAFNPHLMLMQLLISSSDDAIMKSAVGSLNWIGHCQKRNCFKKLPFFQRSEGLLWHNKSKAHAHHIAFTYSVSSAMQSKFLPLLFFTLIWAWDRQNLIMPMEQTHHMTTQEVSYSIKGETTDQSRNPF